MEVCAYSPGMMSTHQYQRGDLKTGLKTPAFFAHLTAAEPASTCSGERSAAASIAARCLRWHPSSSDPL